MDYEGPPQAGDHVEDIQRDSVFSPGVVTGFGRDDVVYVRPHDPEMRSWYAPADSLRVVHRPPHRPNW